MRNLLRTLLRWLRHLTSSRDNQTPDVIRIGAIMFGMWALGLSAWDVLVLNHQFDMLNFGGGAAALLGATGAALGLKRRDEPDA